MKYATTILVFCVAALLSLGLVMLYSSSMSPTGASYPAAQVIWCGLGLIAAGIPACAGYRHLQKNSLPPFLHPLVLLAAGPAAGDGPQRGRGRPRVGNTADGCQTPET